MRPPLKDHNAWLWVAAIVAGFIASLLPPPITGSPNALPVSVLIFLLTLAIAWWRRRVYIRANQVAANQRQIIEDLRRREELRQQFALCKPAEELRPRDLGFQPMHPDQQADP